jgi:FKBP-type peptidyl-prolyl cis-trans isomerase (trigger factor)
MSSFGQERQRRTNRNCQSLWRRSDTVTRQEIEQKMDELAREYHDTHDPEIPEEIFELARRLREMEH